MAYKWGKQSNGCVIDHPSSLRYAVAKRYPRLDYK